MTPPESVEVDGVAYVRAHTNIANKCRSCGQDEPIWTPIAIIEAAQLWAEWAGHTPRCRDWRSARAHGEPIRPVEETVYRVFGGWLPMVRAAGLTPAPSGAPKVWTRERCADSLIEHRVRYGAWPKTTDWRKSEGWHPHYRQVSLMFGSWAVALDFARGREVADGFIDASDVQEALQNVDSGELDGIAEEAGLSSDYLYRIKRGAYARVRLSFADRILTALDRPDVLAAA